MKVPDLENLNMDSKLKFSDRLKALLKTESRQDVDPYIFSEPEPFVTAAGKSVKLTQPKSPRVGGKNSSGKSRGKCIKRRVKIEGSGISPIRGDAADAREPELDAETAGSELRSLELRFPGGIRQSLKEEEQHELQREQQLQNQQNQQQQAQHQQQQQQQYLQLQQQPQPQPQQQQQQQQQPGMVDGPARLETRRQSRDHTLLYYPRAGDEISDSESSGDELSIYQRHWFAGETTTSSSAASLSRAARLSQLRSQLRRRLVQLHKGGQESEVRLRERTRCLLEAACKKPQPTTTTSASAIPESPTPGTSKIGAGPLLVGGACGADGCRQTSLPCTRHCSRHIMLNADQLLFEHCTAKFSDNTQCCVPVFDVAHELPLCPEHARKRDNYHRKAQESKPKKSRKKPASPVAPRPKCGSKPRPKKRKRPPSTKLDTKIAGLASHEESRYPCQAITANNENHTKTLNNLNAPQGASNSANLNLGLGLGSLAPLGLGPGLNKVELGDHEVFASLDPAEHDFGNVLNNLPADAFNDLFIESRNGEYEPSREEEEELERALEAVDKDVRNLERMGQTHGLLEPALLAQLMSDIAS